MTTLHLQADSTTEGSDIFSMAVKVRTSLAIHHLFAACRFTARIRQIERENEGKPLGDFWEEILHNALGVLTLSVAALETYANELYFEDPGLGTDLNPASKKIDAELIERQSVLCKYEFVLAIRSGVDLPKGHLVVQNVQALLTLRNAIVHFRPEWHGEEGEHAKKSRQVKHRFPLSQLFPPGEPALPRAWASGSFAIWALKSVTEFFDYFCVATTIANPCDSFRTKLSLYSDGAI